MKTLINIRKIRFNESLLFAIVLAMVSISCQIGEDDNLECIGNKYPSLPDQQLKTAYLNQYYYDDLTASMKNEPNNDDYYYDFKIEGLLPNGIEVSMNHRTLTFKGLPLEIGTFKFEIILNIEPYYPESTICITYNTSKEYTLVVE